jgi:hypothetical protein
VNPILRNVLAVIAGLVGGFVVIMLVEMLGMAIDPPPPGLEPEELMRQIPVGPLLMVELAYALGSLTGGAVATKLGVANEHPWLALIVGIVLTAAGISNLVMLPHPTWFAVLSTLTFVPLAILGARLVAPRDPANSNG